MEKDSNYYYKGLYYVLKNNKWFLFDDFHIGNVWVFDADYCRLDECFNNINWEDRVFEF